MNLKFRPVFMSVLVLAIVGGAIYFIQNNGIRNGYAKLDAKRELAGSQEESLAVAQGLAGPDSANFSHLSQGSDTYPYEWMKVLRSVNAKDKDGKLTNAHFLSDLDKRFNLVPAPYNKDEHGREYLLPWIGISASWNDAPPEQADAFANIPEEKIIREINGVKSIKFVGTNCASCHSGAITYRGAFHVMQGAPNLFHVRAYFQDLMQSTVLVLAKEDKLVQFLTDLKVSDAKKKASVIHKYFLKRLGEDTGETEIGKKFIPMLAGLETLREAKKKDRERLYHGRAAIRDSLEFLLRTTYGFSNTDNIGEMRKKLDFLASLAVGSDPKLVETPVGYGRSDAFGRIGNLFVRGNEQVNLTGPSSYPWLWGTQYMALMHNTANTNSVIQRNIGESLSLGAVFTNKPGEKLATNVNMYNQSRLENLMYKIQVPRWETIFGDKPKFRELEIDYNLANTGKQVYEQKCMQCHTSSKMVGPTKQLHLYNVISLKHIGTDPAAAMNVVQPVAGVAFSIKMAGASKEIKESYYDKYKVPESVRAEWEKRSLRGEEMFRDTFLGRSVDPKIAFDYGAINKGAGYQARHLAGVWATGPYLHNGSVPTLMDLLKPAEKRPRFFKTKNREFDPRQLGYVAAAYLECDPKVQADCFDTSIEGNSNTGHDYGTDLSTPDRDALLEYLKILPPEPEYMAGWPKTGQ